MPKNTEIGEGDLHQKVCSCHASWAFADTDRATRSASVTENIAVADRTP